MYLSKDTWIKKGVTRPQRSSGTFRSKRRSLGRHSSSGESDINVWWGVKSRCDWKLVTPTLDHLFEGVDMKTHCRDLPKTPKSRARPPQFRKSVDLHWICVDLRVDPKRRKGGERGVGE